MRRRQPTGFLQRGLALLVRALLVRALLVSTLTSVAGATAARAEAAADMAVQSDEPAAYRERIDEALREFSVQNYEEARSLFLQAHALLPSARTLRALGLCEYELRNYGESVKYLDAALSSKVKPLPDALRADTERMFARARNFVGRVLVALRPASAQLLVDGVKVENKDEPLWLAMGEHTLEASGPGFLSEKRRLSVKGGEDKTLSFILTRAEDTSARGDAAPAGGNGGRRWYTSPWLWTSVGLVLAGAAAGTAVALTRDDGVNHDGGSTGKTLPAP